MPYSNQLSKANIVHPFRLSKRNHSEIVSGVSIWLYEHSMVFKQIKAQAFRSSATPH